MLVVVSDLHLTDGSTSRNPHGSAFELLGREIVEAATGRGSVDRATDIELVLLGDIFDVVRTDYWQSLPSAERPWHGTLSRTTGMNTNDARNAAQFSEALRRICEHD